MVWRYTDAFVEIIWVNPAPRTPIAKEVNAPGRTTTKMNSPSIDRREPHMQDQSQVPGKSALLDRAQEHYFSMGTSDGTSSLCKMNMKYGIAKIHYLQESLGMNPNGFFISTPDETISRNAARWNSGFGYGGKLKWGPGDEKLVILDVKPNYCGILAGGLDTLPAPENLISKITNYVNEELTIDGFIIESDFHKSNHFIDLFEVTPHFGIEPPDWLSKFVFFIHGSCPELRDANKKGPGLYIDKSKFLRDACHIVKTPFGPLHYLDGTDAREYIDFCRYADKFSKKKRLLVARRLFGDFIEISNATHQGLIDYNTLLLGSQNTEDPGISTGCFPIALRGDLPAYLFKGRNNLDPEIIEILGFFKRAERLELLDELKRANIIPHGGGYKFEDISQVMRVFTVNDRRFFVCELENDTGMKIVEDVSALEFTYRGKEVIRKTTKLELGEPVAKLVPKYVLKI
ncbi:hypothetical protein GF325_14955 [Candidatus Bathyarchaeota archaeon]|nr:hypothetical protein [Candidatus Bathyarchaeota archaeon]